MIKISISKVGNGSIERIIDGEKHKFTPVAITTRNNVLNTLIGKGELYGKVLYNPTPVHNLSAGDLVIVREILPPRGRYVEVEGIDCSLESWIGHEQTMYKTDLQLLKWEGYVESENKEA